MSAPTNGQKKIRTIVITGGPCGGKTTAMSWLQNALTSAGYAVIFLTETFTELANGGISSYNCKDNFAFQRIQVRYQLERERLYRRAAEALANDNVVIVHDRGSMDDKPYMTPEEFAAILKELEQDEVSFRDKYDAVFHLVTAAKGAEQFYTLANNAARYETVEEAVRVDDGLITSWTGHPHLRVIDNRYDFQGKMMALITEISAFLGEPRPLETRRKYLIRIPDTEELERRPNCCRVEILQAYLRSAIPGEMIRIRQRGRDGHYLYYKTRKQLIDGKRIELEERMTKDEFFELLAQADPEYRPIRKERYCLSENGLYYNIDIYPQWQDQALMEIELYGGEEKVDYPQGIEIIREVTGEEAFTNPAIARIPMPDAQ